MVSFQIFVAVCIFAALCAACAVFFCQRLLYYRKKLKKQRLNIATSVHDICSPLTNIKGYADALLDGTLPQDKAEQSLAVISMESQRIASLARRMDKEYAPEKSVFGICDTAARMCIIFENAAKAKGICINTLLPDEEIYVFADSDGITEALYNIINNAVKYCPDGGCVDICVKDLFEHGPVNDKVSVCVSNHSAHIPQDTLNGIFLPFNRGENSANTSGKGLGLYIAHKIITAHGCKISASCENGIFTVEFCLEKAK